MISIGETEEIATAIKEFCFIWCILFFPKNFLQGSTRGWVAGKNGEKVQNIEVTYWISEKRWNLVKANSTDDKKGTQKSMRD